MQERQVTIGENTFPLDDPFLVLATQNPIEQEGTYPLPEAQVDRFMLKLAITYPSRDEELEIMRRMTTGEEPKASTVITPKDIIKAREVTGQVYIDPKIENYIVDIVFATREPSKYGLDDLDDLIAYGASPRASIYLSKPAKAHAFISRRGYVTPEDVRAIGMDVLRHRIIVTYEAEAEDVTAEDVVRKILNKIEVPWFFLLIIILRFDTVHFLITPDLTPYPDRLLPLGEGWGEGLRCGLKKIYNSVR